MMKLQSVPRGNSQAQQRRGYRSRRRMNVFLAKKRAELKQRESAGTPVFSEGEICEVPQPQSFTMLEATLRANAGTPELLETARFKDLQIQPHVANKPASTVAAINKNSDSAQCSPLSIETTPSAAPGCGSDESSRGSPVANRTRSRVDKVEIIKPSHFQSETAVASDDHACVGNESQSVGYTSSKTQLLLQIN